MPAASPPLPTPVSGHVFVRPGKLRSVWVAKWRDGYGQHKKVLGRDWTEKGQPPAGYLRKKDAEAQLQAILTDARRGVVEQLRTGATFDVVCEEWLAWGVRDRDWKPSTLSGYRSDVNAHLVPSFGAKAIEKITAEQIEDWRDALVDERGLSRRSVNRLLTVMGSILERTKKTHGLLANPVREVPKLRVRWDPNAYDFFTPDEIQTLGAAAVSDQDRAVFLTAAFTGLRRGELVALRWGDIDFATEALHVASSYSLGTLTAPKSGLVRTVPMARQVNQLLASHRKTVPHGRADLAFPGERGEYLDGSAITRRYKKALEKAKLRKLRFHDLRHTFGTIAIEQASIVQVQAWMGHADVQTTMKYLHHRSKAGDACLLSAAFEPTKPARGRRRTAKSA